MRTSNLILALALVLPVACGSAEDESPMPGMTAEEHAMMQAGRGEMDSTGAAVRQAIMLTADQERALDAPAPAVDASHAVDPGVEPGAAHPLHQPVSSFAILRREKGPMYPATAAAELRQLAEIGQKTICVDLHAPPLRLHRAIMLEEPANPTRRYARLRQNLRASLSGYGPQAP